MPKEQRHKEGENPFFRGNESEYNGGDMQVKSVVGSIWGDYAHNGSNAMETGMNEQLKKGAKKGSKS